MNPAVPSRVQALAKSPELTSFCSTLERFIETGEGADLLPSRAAALAAEAKSLSLPPEHILYALRVARCRVGHGSPGSPHALDVSRRYATGIALLLRHYFDVAEDDIEPVGDVSRARSAIEREFRTQVAVRMVVDARSGALWRVRLVCEGPAGDAMTDVQLREALLCESGEDYRYVSPVPADWLHCDDAVLLSAIRQAPRDTRHDHGQRE